MTRFKPKHGAGHSSGRARRGRAAQGPSKLQLVSLMDIFTILIFFLMVNSGEINTLPKEKSIKLPTSSAHMYPQETITLLITQQHLIVEGRTISSMPAVTASKQATIPALEKELNYLASRQAPLSGAALSTGRAITIMGDQATPYKTLKKILATCAQTDFRDVSLAVKQTQETREPTPLPRVSRL